MKVYIIITVAAVLLAHYCDAQVDTYEPFAHRWPTKRDAVAKLFLANNGTAVVKQWPVDNDTISVKLYDEYKQVRGNAISHRALRLNADVIEKCMAWSLWSLNSILDCVVRKKLLYLTAHETSSQCAYQAY